MPTPTSPTGNDPTDDAVADAHVGHIRPDFDHFAHEFVTEYVASLHGRNESVVQVQVGTADAAGHDPWRAAHDANRQRAAADRRGGVDEPPRVARRPHQQFLRLAELGPWAPLRPGSREARLDGAPSGWPEHVSEKKDPQGGSC